MNNLAEPIQVGPTFKMPGVVYPPIDDLVRYVAAGMLGQQTLIEAFMETHVRFADQLALTGPEGNFTHRELDQITDQVASAFLDLGLKPLDRVVFQVPNCNELMFGFFGCLKAGLIPVCTLVSHREREIAYLASHSEAVLHFVQGDDPKFDHVEFAHRMKAHAPSLQHIVVARGPARDGALSLRDLYEAQDPVRAKLRVKSIERDPFQVILFPCRVVPQAFQKSFHDLAQSTFTTCAQWRHLTTTKVVKFFTTLRPSCTTSTWCAAQAPSC
jgi:2,3-dihydroxybenzoate-AMP ligase